MSSSKYDPFRGTEDSLTQFPLHGDESFPHHVRRNEDTSIHSAATHSYNKDNPLRETRLPCNAKTKITERLNVLLQNGYDVKSDCEVTVDRLLRLAARRPSQIKRNTVCTNRIRNCSRQWLILLYDKCTPWNPP